MPLKVGAERRCSDHWLLSSSQDGLYGIKSGSSREFMLSGKGECFWIHEEGPWIKSENPPAPKHLFPRVICARVSPRPLPRSRHLALSYPPRARASPLAPFFHPLRKPGGESLVPKQSSPLLPTPPCPDRPMLSPSGSCLPFPFPGLPHLCETPKLWLRRLGRCEGGLFSGGAGQKGEGGWSLGASPGGGWHQGKDSSPWGVCLETTL